MASSCSSEVEDDEVTFHPRHTVRRSPSQLSLSVYDVTAAGSTVDTTCFVTDSHDYNPSTVSHHYALGSRGYVSESSQMTYRSNLEGHSSRVVTTVGQK